jgi:hypothetical protein
MRTVLFVILVVSAATGGAFAQATQILIFGGAGHREFLGCLNCSQLDSASVWNDISQYGWHNGIGKWNDIGQYGSSIGSYSACNDLSTDPPVLVDKQGNSYGRLSINELLPNSVCGISGNDRVCAALKVMCAQH